MESLPGRPLPSRPLGEAIRAWLHWFGLVRLVVTAAAVLAVGAGAFWLLRTPVTPVEQSLPMAGRGGTAAATSNPTSTHSSVLPGSQSVPVASAAPGTIATVPAGTTADPPEIVVHVAGAVLHAGVFRLPAGARAEDALERAGGVAADADADALNLAAPLHDGDRLYVPHRGQPVPTMVVPSGGVPSVGGSGTVVASGPIDLNRATVDQLDALPGIGPATAAAIIAHRDEHGPFSSVEDLLQVRGIGPAKLDAIRSLVTV